jgi:hypothetical protein
MRLSELLGRPVVDAEGMPLGEVRDVRLVKDGPVQGTFGAAFRVDGLIVGRYEVASRLGFDRRGVKGPWLVATIVRRLARSSRFVAWEHVDATEHVITLRLPADELHPPAPLPQLRTGSVD